MPNKPSEQIRSDLSLDIALDKTLTSKQKEKILKDALGNDNVQTKLIGRNQYYIYSKGIRKIVLLVSQVTYLGEPHPEFKKRVQLKKWFIDVVNMYIHKEEFEIKFIGIYHYNSNTIFVDFNKDKYITRRLNNSSAHVYTNDLFQAMQLGQFRKTDTKNNIITTIKFTEIKNYLDNGYKNNNLLDLFAKFNSGLKFGEWINAFQVMLQLREEGSSDWAQSEWAGFYIEHEFNKFNKNFNLENIMKYVKNKKEKSYDFDIWFDKQQFFGDLKASDINKSEAPGNDQNTFIECINKYGKFWYVIYEHETVKDSKEDNYLTTKKINNYKKENGKWPKGKPFDELSYYKNMKKEVKFKRMHILELNRINYRDLLVDFNQGHQPNGEKRNIKFKIVKKYMDNFSIFNYTYDEIYNNINSNSLEIAEEKISRLILETDKE